jgi:hypothetical protein
LLELSAAADSSFRVYRLSGSCSDRDRTDMDKFVENAVDVVAGKDWTIPTFIYRSVTQNITAIME